MGSRIAELSLVLAGDSSLPWLTVNLSPMDLVCFVASELTQCTLRMNGMDRFCSRKVKFTRPLVKRYEQCFFEKLALNVAKDRCFRELRVFKRGALG